MFIFYLVVRQQVGLDLHSPIRSLPDNRKIKCVDMEAGLIRDGKAEDATLEIGKTARDVCVGFRGRDFEKLYGVSPIAFMYNKLMCSYDSVVQRYSHTILKTLLTVTSGHTREGMDFIESQPIIVYVVGMMKICEGEWWRMKATCVAHKDKRAVTTVFRYLKIMTDNEVLAR